jgi:hypothetical protein
MRPHSAHGLGDSPGIAIGSSIWEALDMSALNYLNNKMLVTENNLTHH